jgi:hypothetical protein
MNGREMNRAERFEDEKRRIIESCFSKKDEDGSSKRPSPILFITRFPTRFIRLSGASLAIEHGGLNTASMSMSISMSSPRGFSAWEPHMPWLSPFC